jgi:hypothetical protein
MENLFVPREIKSISPKEYARKQAQNSPERYFVHAPGRANQWLWAFDLSHTPHLFPCSPTLSPKPRLPSQQTNKKQRERPHAVLLLPRSQASFTRPNDGSQGSGAAPVPPRPARPAAGSGLQQRERAALERWLLHYDPIGLLNTQACQRRLLEFVWNSWRRLASLLPSNRPSRLCLESSSSLLEIIF